MSAHDIDTARRTPPDEEESGRLLSPEEKLDGAMRESMDASDPPGSGISVGAPRHAVSTDGPSEEAVQQRARELWEADGRPSGGDKKYRIRAEMELRAATSANPAEQS